MNPLTGIALIIGGVLNLAWGTSVSLSNLSISKGKMPTWVQNLSTVGVLTPVYYTLFIGTLGFLVAVPLSAGSIVGAIWTTPVLISNCLITFSRRYSEVRTTAEGRALCVVIFSALSIALIPVAMFVMSLP